eukprot:CAMPEP_0183456040 /NCGR_PEP_ID=MMETSP0370-20130417/127965_1 /TAXON_ID=268820 /ORGANISM="Peridinium aciculiferum, Strain PAER-2" /LENGTH=153 /DNA_ID=CAMNT_0025647657 /DNA_START=457 /DNA_END=918 /DNA_ORIENTATION=+
MALFLQRAQSNVVGRHPPRLAGACVVLEGRACWRLKHAVAQPPIRDVVQHAGHCGHLASQELRHGLALHASKRRVATAERNALVRQAVEVQDGDTAMALEGFGEVAPCCSVDQRTGDGDECLDAVICARQAVRHHAPVRQADDENEIGADVEI